VSMFPFSKLLYIEAIIFTSPFTLNCKSIILFGVVCVLHVNEVCGVTWLQKIFKIVNVHMENTTTCLNGVYHMECQIERSTSYAMCIYHNTVARSRNVYTSSAIITTRYHLTRGQRFYVD
jgi:hypothetical protein